MATTTREKAREKVPESTAPEWMALARVGATVMVVFAVTLQATARAIIPPVLVIGLVFLTLIPYLKGERRRVGLAAAIFALAAYLGNLPIILDDLQNPDSAPSFILQLLSTAGVFLVIAGGIGAIFGRPTRLLRPFAMAAAGVFLAGTIGSVAIAANTDSALARPDDVRVTAQELMWAPEEILIDSTASGIWVDNKDGVRHTFTIPALGIDLEVPGLKAGRIDINAPAGTYQIICTVPGHDSMTGTLTISG